MARRALEDVEREFAATWRAALSRAEHAKLAMIARDVFAISQTPKNFYDAGKIAEAVVSRTEQYETNIVAGCAILGVDDQDAAIGLSRWIDAGRPPLASYYPYFSHCLSVDLFFHVAVDKTLISPDRASNKLDISYLYYLPFCQIFVSNDKLHKKSAPLFINQNQIYVHGQELKADLERLTIHYSAMIDEIEKEGLFRVAANPPDSAEFLTRRIWDMFMRRPAGATREGASRQGSADPDPSSTEKKSAAQAATVAQVWERIEAMKASPEAHPSFPFDIDSVEDVAIERKVPLRRGKWRFLPQG